MLRRRQLPGVERGATELGRRRAGGIATEVEGLEKRCQRRLVGARGTGQGGDEETERDHPCPGGEPGGRPCFQRRWGARRHGHTRADDLLDTPQEGVAIHNRRPLVFDDPLLAEAALRIDQKK